jgi:nucleoid-associated protein YgaU
MDRKVSSTMKKLSKYESEISSILGMVVVAALAIFIFLFVKRFMPKPNITPVAEETSSAENLMKNAGTTYTVKAGQGLSQVAQDVYKDASRWSDIAQANDLKAPYTLVKGQVLKLPEGVKTSVATVDTSTPVATATPKAEVSKPTPAPTKVEEKATTPSGGTYVVQKGDSLWKIAVAQYGDGYQWVKIYNANKAVIGKNPGIIRAGQILSLAK